MRWSTVILHRGTECRDAKTGDRGQHGQDSEGTARLDPRRFAGSSGRALRNPRAWLFQIVYHTFISQYRKDERRGRSYEDLRGDEPGPENLRDPLPALIASEDVREAVEKLPEEFRAVVWLSDAEQLRLREIAELLGCPLGTVASRLARGRQELRRLLSAYGPQGEK